jgi:hypothetical protein
MFTIDPRRADLAREFKRCPFGPHSPELQAVLNVLRGSLHCQNLLLVCTRPHAEWTLAEKQPHGLPPRLIPELPSTASRRPSGTRSGCGGAVTGEALPDP